MGRATRDTGAFDNPRGFFERSDVIAQNDAFLKHQRTNWALKSEACDARAGLAAALRPGEVRSVVMAVWHIRISPVHN